MTDLHIEHFRDGELLTEFNLDTRMTHWDMYIMRCEGHNDSFMVSDKYGVSLLEFEHQKPYILCHVQKSYIHRDLYLPKGGDDPPYDLMFTYDGIGPVHLRAKFIPVTQITVHQIANSTKTGVVDGEIISTGVDDFCRIFVVKSGDHYFHVYKEDLPDDILEQLDLILDK